MYKGYWKTTEEKWQNGSVWWVASRRNKITRFLRRYHSWSSNQPLKPLSLSLSLLSSSLIMEKPRPRLLLLLVFFIYGVSPVISDGSDHRYKVGDDVPLYANKVGPFHNPRSVANLYSDLISASLAPLLWFLIPILVSRIRIVIVAMVDWISQQWMLIGSVKPNRLWSAILDFVFNRIGSFLSWGES